MLAEPLGPVPVEPTAKIYNPRPPHAAFLRRPCLGNAAGAATIGAMLRELDAFQRAASPEMGRVSGEGQASYGELESWLGSVVPASARVERICEIGLNRGESAVAWLCIFCAVRGLRPRAVQCQPGRGSLPAARLPRPLPSRRRQLDRHTAFLGGGPPGVVRRGERRRRPSLCRGSQRPIVCAADGARRSRRRDDDTRCTTWWCKPP